MEIIPDFSESICIWKNMCSISIVLFFKKLKMHFIQTIENEVFLIIVIEMYDFKVSEYPIIRRGTVLQDYFRLFNMG